MYKPKKMVYNIIKEWIINKNFKFKGDLLWKMQKNFIIKMER